MKSAKSFLSIVFAVAIMSTLWSCSASVYSSTTRYTDDLYATHDKNAIAKQVAAEREYRRAAAQAAAEAAAKEQDSYRKGTGNPYQDILADDYESAYARRLRGFESPTYNMPSSYYNFRYGSDAHYASAYDPSFYNVMVMGDEVWVEPKYITSMFGTWGRPVNVNLSFGWGVGSWGYPSWGFGSSWNYPYYGWGSWGYPYHGWGYPSYGWGGYYPHYGWGGYHHWGYPHYGWGAHYPIWGRSHYDKNTTYRSGYTRYPNSGVGSGSSSGYRTPSRYSSSGSNSSGTTSRGTSSTSSYRNRYDKSSSSSSNNNRYETQSRPSSSTPSTSRPSISRPSSGSSSSGGTMGGGSTIRSGGSRGR